MMVLLQYAVEDGPITLYEVWRRPIRETLALIEWICQHTVVGFNLSFDWFHICKVYTIFRLCDPDWIPEEHIDEIAMLEPQGQDGPCVKPAAALDLMLHSRKGPYQSLMAREDVRIKRVPTALAYALAKELEARSSSTTSTSPSRPTRKRPSGRSSTVTILSATWTPSSRMSS